MGLELEFKYALTGPGQLEELRQELEKAFGPWEAVEMETVYYDTPDQALAARHWTLRVRQENGRPVRSASNIASRTSSRVILALSIT